MTRLDSELQMPLAAVFDRLLVDARSTARRTKSGTSELDFIENFHALVAANLETEVRKELWAAAPRSRLSVRVDTALVHGGPFFVLPHWKRGKSKGVEIGDLLLVAERHSGQLGASVPERQALLLQLKVETPTAAPRGTNSTANQAALYAHWPPFDWRSQGPPTLPGPFPRRPAPAPCDAAQFAILDSPSATFEALPLELSGGQASFGAPRDLAGQLARTVRLDLGVDATPVDGNGWPRIVEDLLKIASVKPFRVDAKIPSADPIAQAHRDAGASRGRFVVIRVALADPGLLD
jgi:hypothetical protein